ncbi:cupin domain-containing protein [Haloarchaeobius sp. HME9146]|uniref:cupin domain-containing protein n=1 Tax=Haloarchaeobius sp. HME9146 TaxID=2978732 RepID=UPI0021BF63C6|nr:cupin domain-containing protein [Haloarchaeobius sp. HME9146]MCT9094726.1 cupin domain-containing protein [Haloarchaeobius sp. HME9146]
MGYHVIDVDDLDVTPDRPSVQRSLSDAAGLSKVAVNVYEADPGEQLPLAYHYHDEQEEVFYVLSGTLHVETPDGDLTAGPDEAVVITPDSPQRAYNPAAASDMVRVLAIGAPAVDDDAHAYDPDHE